MRVVIASHGHCFDGLSSAVMFTELFSQLHGVQQVGGATPDFVYRVCGYGPGQKASDETLFVGDENALLDYRFSRTPKLTWFFDHHRTAFETLDDRLAFDAEVAKQAAAGKPGQFFYDPAFSSCTKLIAKVAKEEYGIHNPALAELVSWADLIDSASFASAEAAIDDKNVMLRLAGVVEHHGDDRLYAALVPELLRKSPSEVANSEFVSKLYAPLAKKRDSFIELVRQHAEPMGRVVFVDLTRTVLEAIAKFVTYALYPRSPYSVVVGRLKNSFKISVGHNPWSGHSLDADISAICARYGGGGHPMVGGISFGLSEHSRALQVARDIATELNCV